MLEGIGLERYVPRFAENDVHTIDDLPSKPSKLENLLDITGITGNPGHVKKFKAALKDAQRSGGGGRRTPSDNETKDDDAGVQPGGAHDPAAAIRAAMAEAKARGGGILGGSAKTQQGAITATGMHALPVGDTPSSVRTVEDSLAAATNDIEAASDEDVLAALTDYKSQNYLKLLGLPGVQADQFGAVTWEKHPVMSSGTVSLKAKVLSLRLEPSRCKHPLAAEAYECVLEAARTLLNKEQRKRILTLAVQRRIEDMRRKGEGDVEGGYVSMTGVHYAAGAAASAVANYKGEDEDAHGPAMNPAAAGSGLGLKPSTRGDGGGGRLRRRHARHQGSRPRAGAE